MNTQHYDCGFFPSDQLNVTVLEGATAGSQFARIVATDADSGDFGRVTYSIVSESEVSLLFSENFSN